MSLNLRKIILSFLNWMAKQKLRGAPGIAISRLSKVAYSKILLKDGCGVMIRENCIIEGSLIFERKGGQIEIGTRVFMGGGSQIMCIDRVTIEDDVLISWGCTIIDHNSHSIFWKDRATDVTNWLKGIKNWDAVVSKPIVIKTRAWLGFNVIILKGVTIGEGAVVAAGSVVVEDVAPYTIVAGNPARVVKRISQRSNDASSGEDADLQ